jgi:S-formylglutathione hydrolase FrmB
VRRVAVGIVVLLAAVLVARSVLGADARGAQVERYEIRSRAVGKTLPVTAVVPAGADADDRRPLLVFLHGRGAHGEDHLSAELFAGLAALGSRAPVIVFPNGGVASYWHDRGDGAWERYVLREVIPEALRRLPADARRVAIGGISMGGFGALEIARRHPGRFCAAGGHSPAVFPSAGATAAGAFDDAADFARHDVIAAARRDPRAFAAQPLWVDAGDRDPFTPGIRALENALRAGGVDVDAHQWPGAHEGAYWRAHWAAYLRFYARACARR